MFLNSGYHSSFCKWYTLVVSKLVNDLSLETVNNITDDFIWFTFNFNSWKCCKPGVSKSQRLASKDFLARITCTVAHIQVV